MSLILRKPVMEFGKPYPMKDTERVRYLLMNYEEIRLDQTSNLLVLCYWRLWDGWDGKMDGVGKLTPVDTIVRRRRDTHL